MKISNETKVGALAAITITLLVLGFNFLKGKTFFSNSRTFYAKYSNVQGLLPSNPVVINGMDVGSIYAISSDKNMKEILVTINLTKDVNIPTNSIAVINPSLLSTTSMEIKLGDANSFVQEKGIIPTAKSAGVFDEALKRVDPVLFEVRNAVKALDSVLLTVNSIVDPASKNNIRNILDNLSKTSANLTVSSASLNDLLNAQTGALAKTLTNVSSFTGNLAKNNDKFTSVISNLDKTTANLSTLDIQKTLTKLDETVVGLKASLAKLNTTDGTAGMLLNDKRLYNNLAATANKINVLIDDLKTNPKRYISFSVFGKKAKGTPLAVPLPDTLNAPYIEVK